MTYAFAGYGVCSSALGLHAFPSDLDLYLFLALVEYLSATGDYDFLNTSLPFYPANSTALPPGAAGYRSIYHLPGEYLLDAASC